MTTKTLPPQVRRRINKLAHKLALAAEATIRERLTAQARTQTDPDAGLRALTDADLAAMSLTDAEVHEWLKARAWNG